MAHCLVLRLSPYSAQIRFVSLVGAGHTQTDCHTSMDSQDKTTRLKFDLSE